MAPHVTHKLSLSSQLQTQDPTRPARRNPHCPADEVLPNSGTRAAKEGSRLRDARGSHERGRRPPARYAAAAHILDAKFANSGLSCIHVYTSSYRRAVTGIGNSSPPGAAARGWWRRREHSDELAVRPIVSGCHLLRREQLIVGRRQRRKHRDELVFRQFATSSVGLTGCLWRGVKPAVCRRLVRLVPAARCAAQQHTLTARTASDLRHCNLQATLRPSGRPAGQRACLSSPLINQRIEIIS